MTIDPSSHSGNFQTSQIREGRPFSIVHVLIGFTASACAMSTAHGQELLWTREHQTFDDWFGSAAAMISDVDGDLRSDVIIGAFGVDCSGDGDGSVELRSGALGTLRASWCGSAEDAGVPLVIASDVDGDGIDDVIASGSGYWEPTQGRDTGRIVLLSGASLLPIWALVGERSDDHFGSRLARIGDIDGDGLDEVITSSPQQGTLNYGRVYVVSTFDASVVRTHDGAVASENFGERLAGLEDVDGDKVPDYAVSTSLLNTGSAQGRIDVFSGASGSLLWSTEGAPLERLGDAITGVGDWDLDGLGDIAAFARVGHGVLRIYSPATNTLLIEHAHQRPHNFDDGWGQMLTRIADLDGDAVDDLAVSAPFDGHDGRDTGCVDLVSGRTLRLLFRFYADGEPRGWFGWASGSGGDLTGDGIDDLLVGAPIPLKGAPKGGKVFAFALNDLFLQAEPPAPVPGDTVVVDLRAGGPGTLGLIALIDIDGAPTFEPLLLAPFDAHGELQFCADVDSSVSGMEFTVMGYAVARTGRGPLLDATPFVVKVQ